MTVGVQVSAELVELDFRVARWPPSMIRHCFVPLAGQTAPKCDHSYSVWRGARGQLPVEAKRGCCSPAGDASSWNQTSSVRSGCWA